DDTLAAGVVRAAHELGLAVPSDVAVVGFDDGELAEALGLTTVRQPLEESGRTAMELLLRRRDQDRAQDQDQDPDQDRLRAGTPREVALGLDLIVRGSS